MNMITGTMTKVCNDNEYDHRNKGNSTNDEYEGMCNINIDYGLWHVQRKY